MLAAGDIPGIGPSVPSVAASRNVWAVFAEANVPIVKTLEGNIAVRYDQRRFSDMQLIVDAWWGVVVALHLVTLWRYGAAVAVTSPAGAASWSSR